jgi:hypothetical protein
MTFRHLLTAVLVLQITLTLTEIFVVVGGTVYGMMTPLNSRIFGE